MPLKYFQRPLNGKSKALISAAALAILVVLLYLFSPTMLDTTSMTPEQIKIAKIRAKVVIELIVDILRDLKELSMYVAALVCVGTAFRGAWGGKVPRGWLIGSIATFVTLSVVNLVYYSLESYRYEIKYEWTEMEQTLNSFPTDTA